MSTFEQPDAAMLRFVADSFSSLLDTRSPEQIANDAFTAIREKLQHPELTTRHIRGIGRIALNETFRHQDELDFADLPTIESIDDDVWEETIDPSQPTIGLRGLMGGYGAILAQASQKLRQQGEPVPNIVLLPELAYANEWQSRRGYHAKRGVLVDANGGVYSGDFPEPLQIDATQAAYGIRERKKRDSLRYLNNSEQDLIFSDKARMHAKFEEYGLPHPRSLVREVRADELNIQSLLATNKPFVLKPTTGERGIAVKIVDPARETAESLQTYIKEFYKPDSLVMAETLIVSRPFYHPDSGARLDWNLRSLISGQTIVGSYARAGMLGGPINIACGAEAYSLEEAFRACNLSENEAELIKLRLAELHQRVAETFNAGVMGLDIIIDEELMPHIIEINGERSGGLSNIMLAGNEFADWDSAYRAVKGLQQHLFTGRVKATSNRPHGPTIIPATHLIDALNNLTGETDLEQEIIAYACNQLSFQNSYRFPDDLRELANEYVGRQRGEIAPIAEPTDYDSIADDLKRLMENNEMEAAYQLINKSLDLQPYDAIWQECLLQTFNDLLGEHNKLFDIHHDVATSPAEAIAYARDYLFGATAACNITLHALQADTQHALTDALAQYLLTDKQAKTIDGVIQTIASRPEAAYLQPLSRFLRGLHAYSIHDYEVMLDCLLAGFLSPSVGDGILPDLIRNDNSLPTTATERAARGVAYLHDHNLLKGLSEFMLVEATDQTEGVAQFALGRYLIAHLVKSHTENSAEDIMGLVNGALEESLSSLQNLTTSPSLATRFCATILLAGRFLLDGNFEAATEKLDEFISQTDTLTSFPFEESYFGMVEELTSWLTTPIDIDNEV